MAIELEKQQRNINWFGIIVFIFLLSVIIGLVYFLFFTETPGIEVVAPSILQKTEKIADIQFDPSEVISHPVLKNLRQYGAMPGVGQLGRPNPFIRF